MAAVAPLAAPRPDLRRARCEVLVIGAGACGVQAAWAALQQGARVRLVEARVHSGALAALQADDSLDAGQRALLARLRVWTGHVAQALLRDEHGRMHGAHGRSLCGRWTWRIDADAIVLAVPAHADRHARGAGLLGLDDDAAAAAGLPAGSLAARLSAAQRAGRAAAERAALAARSARPPRRRAQPTTPTPAAAAPVVDPVAVAQLLAVVQQRHARGGGERRAAEHQFAALRDWLAARRADLAATLGPVPASTDLNDSPRTGASAWPGGRLGPAFAR